MRYLILIALLGLAAVGAVPASHEHHHHNPVADAGYPDAKLHHDLMEGYDRHVMPPNRPVDVKTGIALIGIGNVCLETRSLDLYVWERAQWTDDRLKWDPASYADDRGENGVQRLDMSVSHLWAPDLVFALQHSRPQTAHQRWDSWDAMVTPNGEVNVFSAQAPRVVCNGTGWELSDGQYECRFCITSWMQDVRRQDLNLLDDAFQSSADLSFYQPDTKWRVTELTAQRRERMFEELGGLVWPMADYALKFASLADD